MEPVPEVIARVHVATGHRIHALALPLGLIHVALVHGTVWKFKCAEAMCKVVFPLANITSTVRGGVSTVPLAHVVAPFTVVSGSIAIFGLAFEWVC